MVLTRLTFFPTPVISRGKLFTMGYQGEGKEQQELLMCFDARTGRPLWEHRFTDFLSDVIYSRYSITSPTVDPETGQVYVQTTAGLLNCFTPEGSSSISRSKLSNFASALSNSPN